MTSTRNVRDAVGGATVMKEELTLAEAKEILEEVSAVGLVDELYAVAKSEVELEDRRFETLAQRASGLSSAAAVAISIAVGFAKTVEESSVGRLVGLVGVVVYGVGILLGLFAVILSEIALRVRTGFQINEAAAFDRGLLNAATKKRAGQDVALHRRVMTLHFLKVVKSAKERNDKTAGLVRYGQYLFIAFLVFISLSLVPVVVAQRLKADPKDAVTAIAERRRQ